MRRLLWGLALGHAGCESCDFSFGPIPLEIRVTPVDVEANILLCDVEFKERRCWTIGPVSDTGTSRNPDPTPPGTYESTVGWDGYATCRYPAIELEITAPGCEPFRLSLPRSKPTGNGILVEAALDCS